MSDPYLYDKTNVLKNLMGIKDQDSLDDYENTVVNLSLLKLINEDYKIEHTSDIFDIHRRLFSEVYEWAGKARIINIEKTEPVLDGLSVQYEIASNIKKALNHIHNQYFDKLWSTYGSTSLIYELTRYIASIWKIHPFREGNTRAISTYMVFFLKRHGFSLDEKLLKTHAAYVRNALVMASLGEYSDYQYLEKILGDAIMHASTSGKKTSAQSNRYEKIKNIKMKNYTYNYHHQKKDS